MYANLTLKVKTKYFTKNVWNDGVEILISLKKQISIVPGSGLLAWGLKGLDASCKFIFCLPNLRDFLFTLSVDDRYLHVSFVL